MRNGDATTIQDVSEDPWQSDECSLFVLADRKGKIVALRPAITDFAVQNAEKMLSRALKTVPELDGGSVAGVSIRSCCSRTMQMHRWTRPSWER